MTTTIPAINSEAMARVDRIMMDGMGVDTLQLMEIAGYGVADMGRRHCGLDLATNPPVVALAGTGGNGGDAMVAARLLHAWGARCTVLLVKPRDGYTSIAAYQFAILDRMKIPVLEPAAANLLDADLILDGLLGFSLEGDPRGEAARLIDLANTHAAPILAIDLPSGLDATSGDVGTPCVHARWTVTLALPKTGLVKVSGEISGDIWLADIGVPPSVYKEIGITVPDDLFVNSSLVRYR